MAAPGITTQVKRDMHPACRGRMRVTETGKPATPRSSYQVLGLAQPTVYGVHNNNLANLRRGIVERVFCVEGPQGLVPPPAAKPGAFGCRTLQKFRTIVCGHVGHQQPASYREFLACYKGDRRLKVYTDAVSSLLLQPVTPDDARTSSFVKCEKTRFSKKKDPCCRVIQPRHPRYNVEVGRYLKKLEKKIFRAIAALFGGPTVLKGYNAHESAAHLRDMWEEFHNAVAISLDASRFDQHVGLLALMWEHSVYSGCYGSKVLDELLRWQLKTRGIARAKDGFIKYNVDGCRMSGDMNTSMGNCLIMCALVYKLGKDNSIPLRLANNGDDCVVILEKAHEHKFRSLVAEHFLTHGFTMKMEDSVYEFEHIEFCQTKPIWTPSGWLMCRDGLVAMAKDSVSTLPLNQGKMAYGWCSAIGSCGMSLSGGVPIFQEFYSALLRSGNGVTLGRHPALESGFQRLASGMSRHYEEVDPRTRVSFWKAFGVLPSSQVVIEEELVKRTPDVSCVRRRESLRPDLSLLLTEL